MARIRSVKPEFWDDRKLAKATSRDARMLYVGLWNQADEHGRVNGDPQWLKGRIFPYEDDLTPDRIAGLVAELAAAGRLVGYLIDGDPFLFLPNLGKHQRLEPAKAASRLPGPDDPRAAPMFPADPSPAQTRADLPGESAPSYGAGSMEQGTPSAAREIARRDESPSTTDALIADWLEHCAKRPPGQVIGQVGKQVKAMLAEGIDPADVRRGLAAWHSKALHPGTLPSVVHEVMNAPAARASPSTRDRKVAATLALADQLEGSTP